MTVSLALATIMVAVTAMADDVTCAFDEPEGDDRTALARGNA